MNGAPEWMIGRHSFHWEAPDVLRVKLDGDNTLEEATRMVGLYKALGEFQPYFILADSRNAGTMESEARRHMSEHMRHEWFQHVIFYNTRLMHRAMAQGLILAAELLSAEASPMRGRVHFVSTPAKARVLLDELRTQRREATGLVPRAF